MEIVGGVIHAEDGSINAAGNVVVKFAQNARISAGDDIVINGPAMNCDLYAGSRIVVTGKNRAWSGVWLVRPVVSRCGSLARRPV